MTWYMLHTSITTTTIIDMGKTSIIHITTTTSAIIIGEKGFRWTFL